MKYSSYSSHIVWVVLISQNILWTTSSLSQTYLSPHCGRDVVSFVSFCSITISGLNPVMCNSLINVRMMTVYHILIQMAGNFIWAHWECLFFFCKDKRDASVQLVFHPIYSEVSIGQPKHTDSSAALFVCVHLPSITLRLPPRQQPVSVDGLVHTDPVSTPATPGTLCALSQASGRSGKARKGQGTKGQLLAKHWLYIEGSRAYWIYWMHVIHLFIVCLFQTEN